MTKRWKKEEETYLKRYAKKRRVAELAERFEASLTEVQLKLQELELEALDSVEPSPFEADPLLEVFEKGLRAFHDQRWKAAQTSFRKVLDGVDQADVANRVRRYLEVCEGQLGDPPPADDDPYLMAVFERNRGNLDAALAICAAGGRRSKDELFAYLEASIRAVRGELDEAARFLQLAIDLNDANRIHALHDADFDELRASAEHADLFQA